MGSKREYQQTFDKFYSEAFFIIILRYFIHEQVSFFIKKKQKGMYFSSLKNAFKTDMLQAPALSLFLEFKNLLFSKFSFRKCNLVTFYVLTIKMALLYCM